MKGPFFRPNKESENPSINMNLSEKMILLTKYCSNNFVTFFCFILIFCNKRNEVNLIIPFFVTFFNKITIEYILLVSMEIKIFLKIFWRGKMDHFLTKFSIALEKRFEKYDLAFDLGFNISKKYPKIFISTFLVPKYAEIRQFFYFIKFQLFITVAQK